MSNLIPFTYNSKQVRTILKDGEPWFVAKDVCDILELSNGRDAVSRLDEDEKNTVVISDGTPGNPNMTIISEAGLYSLVLTSNKPEAKEFKRWIIHEVIPSIRKTGTYSLQKPQCIEDLIIMQAQSMKELRAEVKQLQSTQQAIKEAVISEPDNWREDINHKINKIARAVGTDKFRDIRTESYKLLEARAHVDLKRRLDNYRIRLMDQGYSKTGMNNANNMDVIEQDPKLREIYGKIVSEYLIKYVA